MRSDFACFILTHGRADKQATLKTLEKCGYTGRVYLIVDDEDEQLEKYKENYGDKVIVFSKSEIEPTFDTMTNRHEHRSVVYARNACFGIAKQLGLSHFMEWDDDITSIVFRVIVNNKLPCIRVHDLDRLFESMIEYQDSANLKILAMSYMEPYIGGVQNVKYREGANRNFVQPFLFRTDNPIKFRGLFNEDFHASLDCGINGDVAFATTLVQTQSPTRGANTGGNQKLYIDSGKYVWDFYSKMVHPQMLYFVWHKGTLAMRKVNKTFGPLILSDKYRKAVG